jgi:hypothetical protein
LLPFIKVIDTHRGARRGRWYNIEPPKANFHKFVNKNAIKPKIGDLPGNFVQIALTPGKNLSHPSPGFSTCVHL